MYNSGISNIKIIVGSLDYFSKHERIDNIGRYSTVRAMKKFNKIQIILVIGIILSVVGVVLVKNSTNSCDSVAFTKGTAEITYTCPLSSSELTEVLFSRTGEFMLEKAILGAGIGLILVWLVVLLSVKFGSMARPTQK